MSMFPAIALRFFCHLVGVGGVRGWSGVGTGLGFGLGLSLGLGLELWLELELNWS